MIVLTKYNLTIFIIIICAVIAGASIYFYIRAPKATFLSNVHITSSAFSDNQTIPARYTCDGANTNPPLEFLDVPKNAKSLAIVVDDPDAPLGTWVHWTLWNISPKTTEIKEDSAPPEAIEGKTSFGNLGYGGPCPPSGTHRYFFKLYALNTKINRSSDTDINALEKAMQPHIIKQAELIGLYSKK